MRGTVTASVPAGYRSIGSAIKLDSELEDTVRGLLLPELMEFTWQGLPLGELVLPSLRWALRRHHLENNPDTLYLFRQYLLSAWNVAVEFTRFLKESKPQAWWCSTALPFRKRLPAGWLSSTACGW